MVWGCGAVGLGCGACGALWSRYGALAGVMRDFVDRWFGGVSRCGWLGIFKKGNGGGCWFGVVEALGSGVGAGWRGTFGGCGGCW
jgi:hypothetical protein